MFLRALTVCLALLPSLTSASSLSSTEYAYPIANPFIATIAGTPSAAAITLPAEHQIKQSDHALRLKKRGELPGVFYQSHQLKYRLAEQDGAAPLMFIIAGTGAHYASGTPELLKKIFYQGGFHVVQLSSPTSWDFMAAASRSATPGFSPDDADDLYRVMQAVLANHPSLQSSSINLTGYSLGGLQAAFVGALDKQRRALNFKRILMLNPPVNLYTSVRNLDRLVQTKVPGISNQQTFIDDLMQRLTRFFERQGRIEVNEAMLAEFQTSDEALSNEQLAMLIGSAFRLSVADIVYTSDLLNQRGLITPKDYPLGFNSDLAPFLKRSLLCDFDCYITQQLIPWWRKKHNGGSLLQMMNQVSLYALEPYLKDNPQIGVMHNADDLILGPGDLGWLRRTMGAQMTLYPRGGHCGNFAYPTNAHNMLEFFHD
ncbi:serine/threonine protein kinase [Atopomonas sediminilitoris]|uniref:serine/threonine protein kinase n=1 Tax=Atopomonas sediminilitoris TaxID=2919919 RepID=UPI001F4E4DDB|nr:serine/threonine protein kinase [Atopomonas sediminilitoris]MCJ8170080.1 serine/threonine protein kinase [Atopomonas sediminilitoris]